MIRTLQTIARVGVLALIPALTASPASAAFITLPFVGDIEHPDMDPFHLVTPEPAAAPAAAPAPKKHHHRKMKKKMKT